MPKVSSQVIDGFRQEERAHVPRATGNLKTPMEQADALLVLKGFSACACQRSSSKGLGFRV